MPIYSFFPSNTHLSGIIPIPPDAGISPTVAAARSVSYSFQLVLILCEKMKYFITKHALIAIKRVSPKYIHIIVQCNNCLHVNVKDGKE